MNRMRAAAEVATIAVASLVGLTGSAQAESGLSGSAHAEPLSYPCAAVLPPYDRNGSALAFGCQGPAGHHRWVFLYEPLLGPNAYCRDVYASVDQSGVTMTVSGYECV